MTFTEAALEVLRSVGEPLHYKKITEIAIERNLLSHVGKTPEVTMSSRLATMVKKDRGEAPIVKVKPGVFAIRKGAMPIESEAQTVEQEEGSEAQEPAETRPAPALPGSDVFPAEEDDDDPILAGLDEANGDDKRGRRRRRRRRGKGERSSDEASAGGPPERERSRDKERSGRNRERERERERGGRREARHESVHLDWSRQPADGDLLGKDLADAAYAVLGSGNRAPVDYAGVAELLVKRGRLSGQAQALAPTVAAAIRADVARCAQSHARPRFRLVGPLVSLTEWSLPRDALRVEGEATRAAERQRDHVRRAFINKLNALPAAGFAEILATWLNAEGVTALRAVRRPGSSLSAFHFAGTQRRGAQEIRLAIVVQRGGREIDRELLIATRGSLQHYGNASAAWLITTGRVVSGAREEATSEAAPVALFDGAELARAMERQGIGLRQQYLAISDIDLELLEALGEGSEAQQAEQEQRERSRERDRGKGRDRRREARDETGGEEEPEEALAAGSGDAELEGEAEGGREAEGKGRERARARAETEADEDRDWRADADRDSGEVDEDESDDEVRVEAGDDDEASVRTVKAIQVGAASEADDVDDEDADDDDRDDADDNDDEDDDRDDDDDEGDDRDDDEGDDRDDDNDDDRPTPVPGED